MNQLNSKSVWLHEIWPQLCILISNNSSRNKTCCLIEVKFKGSQTENPTFSASTILLVWGKWYVWWAWKITAYLEMNIYDFNPLLNLIIINQFVIILIMYINSKIDSNYSTPLLSWYYILSDICLTTKTTN